MNRSILFVAATAAAISGFAAPTFAADALRIGIEPAYPPFSFKEADGTLAGFDVEISLAICAAMERECELIEQEWDGMIPALKARKYDAIVASMSITEERKRVIDFTVKYYQTPARVVALADADFTDTSEGLAGKRIGVQRGTTHHCYAEKMFPDAELILYATQEEVFRDLPLGRIDVQLSDSLIAEKSFLNTGEGASYAFLGGDHLDLDCYGEGVGVAVRQNEEELRDGISAAIGVIRENGAYKEINDKYFSFDIYGGRPASN